MRSLLVCILLLSGVGVAIADDNVSAAEFLKRCQVRVPPKDSEQYGFGYCLGQVGTFMALGPHLADVFRFCPPNAIPLMGIGALARYLKENPEQREEKSLSAMLLAFKREWPCK